MLTKISIQNYRTMTDVTVELDSRNLLMGLNGGGKTTLFDVLVSLRRLLIDGEECEDVFPLTTVPRWLPVMKEPVRQRYQFDFQSPFGSLTYELAIEQDRQKARSHIVLEKLTENQQPLFSFEEGLVQLYRDNHSVGPVYSSDWNRSALLSVPASQDNKKLTWFKERVRGLYCIRADAPRMSARSEKEEPVPARDLSNFASWYRRAFVSDTAAGASFLAAIKDVIEGMDSLNLRELGQGIMLLEAAFKSVKQPEAAQPAPKKYRLEFSELSDGQRALIGLYAASHFLLREHTTLCIDEPDNFVALSEIQPWINATLDLTADNNSQLLLGSHHPEMYNLLAPDHGIVLERQDSGPTIVHKYSKDTESRLSPAERIARGRWA